MGSSVLSPITRGRILQQVLPNAPAHYDQVAMNQLVSAVNNYMNQTQQPGDVVGGRFICSDPIIVGPTSDPNATLQDVSTLPTGTFYLMQLPGAPAGTYYLTVVLPSAPAVRAELPTDQQP